MERLSPLCYMTIQLIWVCFCMISEPEKDSSGKTAPIVLDDDTAHLGLFLYDFRA